MKLILLAVFVIAQILTAGFVHFTLGVPLIVVAAVGVLFGWGNAFIFLTITD